MAKTATSQKGFVYILKDGHFKRGVKIGKASNVERRIRPMLTANPWLSVYVKVETTKWNELERTIHNVIKLVAKRKQVGTSEFYVIEPEKAKRIMLEFCRLFDKGDFAIYENGSKISTTTPTKKTKRRHKKPGKYPFAIGKVAKAMFPHLFECGLVNDNIVTFLQSEEARKRFKASSMIIKKSTGAADECRDAKGRYRYYPDVRLPYNGQKYLVGHELYEKGMPNLLEWFESIGMPQSVVWGVCEKTYGKRG